MTKPTFFFTDVFTTRRYGGNPLATFVDCESLSDGEMQRIAKEINFSETTFILSRQPRDGAFDVRIFTPAAEVDFAGHPTLGTAHVIRERLRLTASDEVALHLRAGRIPVTFHDGPDRASMLWMRQIAPRFGDRLDPARLARVLGLPVADIATGLPIEEVSTGFPTLIVPLRSLEALKRIDIHNAEYDALAQQGWAKIILAFSREGYEPKHDLSVRVFAGFYGVPEDAATGSSNGALAAYLARHRALDAAEINATVGQGYELGRPSTLSLKTTTEEGEIAVFVGGGVVDVAQGTWG